MLRIFAGSNARDRYLLLAFVLGAFLSLYGIWWGWVESWNPDEMAFRSLFAGGRFFEPEGFLKPPFHTYVNFFLSVLPFKALEWVGNAITGTPWSLKTQMLWWSRVIQVILLLGVVYSSFRIVERFASLNAARIVALLTATSAGFILQVHFLTADVPVTFWMLASFYAAQSIVINGRMRDYVLAGLLVGVATATKYNGLAVGLAIPIFHFFAVRDGAFLKIAFDRRLIVGVAMVVVGFILANPYSIIHYRAFASDFAYNYAVTPVYDGSDASQHGFGLFLRSIPEIVGWPVALLMVVASIYAIWRLREASNVERASVAASLGVFLLYFIQFGRPHRVEIRFVMPIVAFLLIAMAPFWSSAMLRYKTAAVAAVTALVAYNVFASFWVSKRFAEDPRMEAQAWVAAHVPPHSTFESGQYTPTWNLYRKIDVEEVRMPAVSGRAGVLSRPFKENASMMQEISQRESDEGIEWYKTSALEQRRPQFIAIDSKYFSRFLDEKIAALAYPDARSFISDLLANRLGYRIVYDRTAQPSPSWLYPRDIDFVDNRIVILQRDVG